MKKRTRIMHQMTDSSGHPSLVAALSGTHAGWTPSPGHSASPRHAGRHGVLARIAGSLQLHEVGLTVPYRDADR